MTIAIVMPCRNAEATLGGTLAGVLSQTETDWRLVAVDDRSTDGTAALLARYAARDQRIAVIDGPGLGVAAARNLGLRHVEGDLVAFLDADDIWTPTRLYTLSRFLAEDRGRQAAYSRYGFFRDTPGDGPTRSTVPPRPLTMLDLLRGNPVGTMSNLIVRRAACDTIGPFREDMTHGEDREWLVRAVGHGLTVVGVDETLLHYRTSVGGLSTDLERMYAGWRESVRSAAALDALPPAEAIRAAEAAYLRYLARRALRLNLPAGTAARYALRGACQSPRGFFSDGTRGVLTLGAALLALTASRLVRHALAHR